MSDDPADWPKLVKVAEGFYVREEVDVTAWIDLGDCALVVDALERSRLKAEVFEAIRSTLGDRPVKYVLNTHPHGDHTALNAAFKRTFGAEIVNQRINPVPPEGRWFEGPRRRVQMLPMPGCHTAHDCVVWVPDDKTLFVGDIFGWGLIPLSNVSDKTAELLRETHNRLIEFDAATVIPGHGPVCTTAELRRWVEYFNWLVEGAARGCAEGSSDEQIRQQLAPPEDMKTWWRFLRWKHEDSRSKVLSAVRAGRLKP